MDKNYHLKIVGYYIHLKKTFLILLIPIQINSTTTLRDI